MKKAISRCVEEGLSPETQGYIYNRKDKAYFKQFGQGMTRDKNEACVYSFENACNIIPTYCRGGMSFDTI